MLLRICCSICVEFLIMLRMCCCLLFSGECVSIFSMFSMLFIGVWILWFIVVRKCDLVLVVCLVFVFVVVSVLVCIWVLFIFIQYLFQIIVFFLVVQGWVWLCIQCMFFLLLCRWNFRINGVNWCVVCLMECRMCVWFFCLMCFSNIFVFCLVCCWVMLNNVGRLLVMNGKFSVLLVL